ncbi:5-formyltetrahydrofolate cyclo-ligase [Undibacterium sp. KW1]|uniref:5-formyltetrahydrofolate cyclo-ligase n=1 Tax=Undibacterium sp. KW1 TaxID=2058624 RepID=UPI001331D5A1|nr:5-formyltetrahydrofolate cyclo-ligase [Undibacterium sp. KW1]BBB62984.1 5-formyltetrahydrofolate cyclo-ligase [Undibacterium sp. KW1]
MTQPKNSAHKLSIETAQSRPELRKLLRKKRQEIAAEQKQVLDAEIGRQLLAWCQQNQPASLGVYWPIQAEPDLRTYYRELQGSGLRLALPLVTGKDMALSFLDWQAGDAMAVDSYGIAIPAHGRLVSQPPVLIIPCLGWNAAGYRLGYGGGFYDRTLAASPRPVAIGIAYACTEAEFASEPHDIAMDFIIKA